MPRISEAALQSVVDRINRTMGTPLTPYTRDESGKFAANVGNYHLDGAYGGWALHQMGSESGGIRDVLRSGHVPKRDLYNQMCAFLEGVASKGEA
jgi:hypothetical protein